MTVRVDVDDDGGGPGAGAGFDSADSAGGHGYGADSAGGHGYGADSAGGHGSRFDEPLIEPLLAELDLGVDVIRAAGFKDEPVLARGIMDGLAAVDPGTLDYRQAVNLLAEAGQLVSAAEALKAKAVARVCATAGDRVDEEDCLPPAGPGAGQLAEMAAESEIRTVLDVSGRGADQLIQHSCLLTSGLPATLNALTHGELNPGQAHVIVDQCGTLPPEAYAEFETEMVAFASGRPRHLLADKGRRLRERSHPETIKRRKQKAAADRTVILEPVEDGMCWLSMYLPAEAATAAFNRLTSVARSLQCPDEGRNLAQLRADVAADLLHTGTGTGLAPAALTGSGNDVFYGTNPPAGVPAGPAAPGTAGASGVAGTAGAPGVAGTAGVAGTTGAGGVHGTAGGPGTVGSDGGTGTCGSAGGGGPGSGRVPDYAGIKAEVFVVVPVLTLMGLSDEPADLEGYGPIDEDSARRLAANAPSFKRILTHPETGALLSYGRGRYGVPKDLKRMVQLRDRRCTEPGCGRSARFCDADHTIPYPAGETELENLKALCEPGHALKTAKLWRDIQRRDGTVDWTSPAGRKYTSTPEGPLPEMRPVPDIADLLEKVKNQSKNQDKSAGKPAGEHADNADVGKADNGGMPTSDPDDPPPF